jgi:hypothetical protein
MICYGQGDDVMKLQRVTARDSGKLLIGLARQEWIPTQKTDIWQLGGPALATVETPIDPDSSSAALTVRDSEVGPYQIIRRDQWKFSADLQQIVVPGGFPFPPVKSGTRLWGNFASQWPVMRALLLAMQDWLGEPLPLLVPSVDADGNERAGIRLPY